MKKMTSTNFEDIITQRMNSYHMENKKRFNHFCKRHHCSYCFISEFSSI